MSGAGRIFVGGLDCAMTRADLEREFGKYGRLKEVWMAQSPPGFAFVEFEDISLVDEAVREMNGAIVNGALLRVERAREKARTPRGGGAFRSRSRRGGPGSYQQAGFERKMRRAPTPTVPPAAANPPLDGIGVAGAPVNTAAGYGCYDYGAATGGNPYAAYATGGAPAASWEAPYGTTYYAPAAATGYGAYYGDFYGMAAGMAGMAAQMPVADPATAAVFYQQQQHQQQQPTPQQHQQQHQHQQQQDYGQMMPPPHM